MKRGDAFPSTYLKAEDLKNNRVTVVIERVEIEKVGDDPKPIVHFRGKDKALVLNMTNWSSIEMLTGAEDTDQWAGHTICLYPTTTPFQGKIVPCIRVREAEGAAPEPPPVNITDDDVPF